ncbi:DDT domain-containing protein DDR4-like [Salvia divinorum]|uniref:DDT domain-containing protein DDR4-like n=1 Tax=Salvia divinorum TaxID=28513 RepID=A0ABD1H7L5_SALDI
MAGANRGPAPLAGIPANNSAAGASEPFSLKMTDFDSSRTKLRQRWELASVLNFLHVFRPVIGKDLKLSAEDVETAIIVQNSTLAQLHIALLKGILSSSQAQTLKSPDGWIAALSKALSTWWPWVAEGDFPLTGAKGEEISIYKELNPTTRLMILKALCEVRADQHDAVSYISEQMKNGTGVSSFRKDKLGSDGNRVSFWYDGNETIGHRLYKEVHSFENQQPRKKDTAPALNCQWETLATNLEGFNKIVDEFSSSNLKWEVALAKSIEMSVIPVLAKLQKKKEKALYRLQREQLLFNGFRNFVSTRSCRTNKRPDYVFDKYDRDIAEAIKDSNKRKTSEERMQEEKPSQQRMTNISDGSDNSATSSRDCESSETDTEKHNPEESDSADSSEDEEYVENEEDDIEKDEDEYEDEDEEKVPSLKQNMPLVHRPKGSRFSSRLARVPGHTIPESMNVGSKNRSRQRPSLNTAVETTVVADSEDESSS